MFSAITYDILYSQAKCALFTSAHKNTASIILDLFTISSLLDDKIILFILIYLEVNMLLDIVHSLTVCHVLND